MTTKIQRWGNSLGVRIPQEMARALGLREAGVVSLSIKGDSLVISRPKKPSYTLAELLKKFDSKKQHELVDWGADVGAEVVEW
jgi:antitoxin MazE